MRDSVGGGRYNDSMNKMSEIENALTALGVNVSRMNDTLFVGQWGIFCSFSGNIQARNVYDKDERFGVGAFDAPVEAIVANITAVCL